MGEVFFERSYGVEGDAKVAEMQDVCGELCKSGRRAASRQLVRVKPSENVSSSSLFCRMFVRIAQMEELLSREHHMSFS